ncbi:uncharacterized protein GGS25DRAFT_494814 [Hypoxylon fragiforme]|uniref:uncharacterized protein n=1 Tax=Hypoxylon fragiforme TaxID=63214 RepID=UPI0020C5D8BF|nr:uncharacterized protein GGS25DRAFT_494814 [Hypoxylon fragiforme]KAI2607208.1 hypothetical protein GGS25DRAFT_494814 [Hypoxylon fragiforme]
MATPTLPADWTPTKDGCLRTSDFWIWDYEVAGDARTVLGGPSQISDCLPTSWAGTQVYEGSACPPSYTSACQGSGSNAPVTCCPTQFAYTCLAVSLLGGPHAQDFRCQSRHASAGNIVVTRTAMTANTLAVESRVKATNEHLFALALMYTTPTTTTGISTTSATSGGNPTTTGGSDSGSSSDSDSSSSSFGPAQAAGVGIGAAAGVILIAVFAWFIMRRRKAAQKLQQQQNMHQMPYSRGGELPTYYEPPSELSAVPPTMYELPSK